MKVIPQSAIRIPKLTRRAPRLTRQPRFDPSSEISLKLGNFYDFQDWRDVIRYKTRLQEGLRSTDSTRLPRATLIRSRRTGRTNSAAS